MGSVTDNTCRDSLTAIAFVGCGINALAASIALLHNNSSRYEVQIFEKRAQDVAADAAVAGLHLKPNSTRLLDAWGVFDFFEHARVIRATKISRYEDGSLISVQQRPTSAGQDESKSRTTETWYINRGDLWSVLYKKATELGAKVHFDTNVTEVDPERPSLRFSDGTEASCDLIVGTDGFHSRIRSSLFPGEQFRAKASRDVVFQISIPHDLICSLPPSPATTSLQDLYNDNSFQAFLGPGRFILAATSQLNSRLEMQLVVLEHEPPNRTGPWTGKFEDISYINSLVQDFNPAIKLAFSHAEYAWRWCLGEVPTLPRWSSENGKVLLLGDAAHGSLPFGGLGFSLGIEDAAVLSVLLSTLPSNPDSTSTLPALATLYYTLRQPRITRCRGVTHTQRPVMALPDGPAQASRDAFLRTPPPKRDPEHEFARAFGDFAFHVWLNGFDFVGEAREAVGEKVE